MNDRQRQGRVHSVGVGDRFAADRFRRAALPGRRKACEQVFGGRASSERIVERCVAENWTDRQIECVARAGLGLQGMFCFEN